MRTQSLATHSSSINISKQKKTKTHKTHSEYPHKNKLNIPKHTDIIHNNNNDSGRSSLRLFSSFLCPHYKFIFFFLLTTRSFPVKAEFGRKQYYRLCSYAMPWFVMRICHAYLWLCGWSFFFVLLFLCFIIFFVFKWCIYYSLRDLFDDGCFSASNLCCYQVQIAVGQMRHR